MEITSKLKMGIATVGLATLLGGCTEAGKSETLYIPKECVEIISMIKR